MAQHRSKISHVDDSSCGAKTKAIFKLLDARHTLQVSVAFYLRIARKWHRLVLACFGDEVVAVHGHDVGRKHRTN